MRRKGQCLLKGSGGTPRMGLAEQNSCRITMLFRKNHDFRFHLTCWAAPTLRFLPTLVNTSVPIRDRKWDEGDFSCGNIMGWWVWAKTVGLMGMGQEKCCRCQTTPKKKLFVKWSILAPFSYSQFLSALPSFWLFLVGWLWFIFLLAGSGLIIISRNILLCCRVRICLNDIIIFCQSIPILFRMSWFYPLGWFPNPHGLQNAWCLVRRNIILAVYLVVDILCTVSVYVRSLLVNVWILVISCRYYFFYFGR